MKKIFIPPIKSQGIKTKLVEWIMINTKNMEYDRWVEPFMGTGVVAFNVKPKKTLLCDNNPHIINFYKQLQSKKISSNLIREYLTTEGKKLLLSNGEYYYEVRDRFNKFHNPLDFLFLNRSCFNGMMRFNKKGEFNVPFCHKPNRFAPSLVTKITNQAKHIFQIINYGNYIFKHQDFKDTLNELHTNDLVYSDPPYIGRHVDYFNSWSEKEEIELNKKLKNSNTKFLCSTWLKNRYRKNECIHSIWNNCRIAIKEHFYHIGAKEQNRNSIFEALLSNFDLVDDVSAPTLETKNLFNS